MKKNVLIVPELTATSGFGHLSRAAALSDRLQILFNVSIVIPSAWEAQAPDLLGPGYQLIKSGAPSCSEIEADDLLKSSAAHIVVLDGYGFPNRFKSRIKERTHLVLINDLEFEPKDVDLLINPGLPAQPHGISAGALLGPEYALVRSTFFSSVPHQRSVERIRTVAICFGGRDEHDITAKALNVIAATERFDRIRIIVGNQYSHRTSLEKRIQELTENTTIEFLGQIANNKVLEVFQAADLVMLPASTIAYEACCVGVPMIVGHALENQKAIYRALLRTGAAIGVENLLNVTEEKLVHSLELITKPECIRSLLEAQRHIFGTSPGHKLCQAFLELSNKQ